MRDRALGSTIRIYFSTHASAGAAVAPSSAFAAADFRIYKDGAAAEKTTTNGITVASPFDSLTGGHLIEVDTSNNTGDTGFFSDGSAYRVVLSTAKTVDSQSVSGILVGEFSLNLQTSIATLATSQPHYAPATSAQAVSIASGLTDALAAIEDVPNNAEFEARTLAAASYGTTANQTTILARLGSWTGSGLNTILGAFRALLSKAAATPSDIGGTFDAATDSTEAIRDRGDAAWVTGSSSGTGTGARTLTITVNDGSTVLQNARVRLTEGANTYTGLSNASGVVTFNVDDASYTVSITKSGYSYAGATLVVDGDEAQTYSMTANSSTPPDDPALCAVTIPIVNQFGAALTGQVVEIRFNEFSTGADTTALVLSPPPTLTSDDEGLIEVNLLRDGKYSVFYGQDDYRRRLDFTVPDAGSFTVGE